MSLQKFTNCCLRQIADITKTLLISQIYTVPSLILQFSSFSKPALADFDGTTYSCGFSGDIPATIARTPDGLVPLLIWDSEIVGSDSLSQWLCENISKRLQDYENEGILSYLTVDSSEERLVVCVSVSRSGLCSGVLFALPLEGDDDPSEILTQLVNLDALDSNDEERVVSYSEEGAISISISRYLQYAFKFEERRNDSDDDDEENPFNPGGGGSVGVCEASDGTLMCPQ